VLAETIIPCPLSKFYLADHRWLNGTAAFHFGGGRMVQRHFAYGDNNQPENGFTDPKMGRGKGGGGLECLWISITRWRATIEGTTNPYGVLTQFNLRTLPLNPATQSVVNIHPKSMCTQRDHPTES